MTNALLYTLPQWLIFAAFFGVVYGWIEDKKLFRAIGMGVFVLLGIFSVYIISGGYLAPGAVSSAPLPETATENGQAVYVETRLLPAYLSFIVASVLAVLGVIFDLKNMKYARMVIVVTGLTALVGFFIVVGIIRSY